MRDLVSHLVLLREPLESLAPGSLADEVTIHFPWGSLLSGALAENDAVFEAICRLPQLRGTLPLMVSVISRDGRRPLSAPDIARVVRAYRSRGLVLLDDRPVERADVEAARSSWGKRLDVGGVRPGHLLTFAGTACRPGLR